MMTVNSSKRIRNKINYNALILSSERTREKISKTYKEMTDRQAIDNRERVREKRREEESGREGSRKVAA